MLIVVVCSLLVCSLFVFCKLLCCAAEHRQTWYDYGKVRNVLKLRGASDGLRTCILNMMAEVSGDRYSMDQALCDPWLQKASKLNQLDTSCHFHPPTESPQPSLSHAPAAALALTNASRFAVNKPAVKAVFSPRRTRAGTNIDTQASIKRAAKVLPVPTMHAAVKPIKEKAQLSIHINRHSAASTQGVSCIYGIGLSKFVKLHDCPTMILR